MTYTKKQGQYLSFIYYYIKLNKQAPAHRDFQLYFEANPSSVNDMLKLLERKGYIQREAGKARSIKLLLDRADLPDLA
ncbi:MAG: MarR family transcriptional regulator [Bacteroidota bacterium]